ncbi:MAG: histidine kinase [Cyanobacteria bacterium]|nr:histidine kinase [Cyanobacteriota bacterium]
MIIVSLAFLFLSLFGAYAYGAATYFSIGQARSLWGLDKSYAPAVQVQMNKASLGIFVISTVWFVLNALMEFRNLTGNTGDSWLELAVFIVFLYPPVIMHTVYLESHHDAEMPPPLFRGLLRGMYVLSPAVGVWLLLTLFRVLPRPEPIGAWIGISIGSMFVLCSAYSTALMMRRPKRTMTADQAKLRTVMISLFVLLSASFFALIFMRQQQLLMEILDRLSRSSPVFFMVASVYFEDRFAFYDLVIKRGLTLLLSIVVAALFLTATLPWLEALPTGAARPWLFAAALAPLALLMPWLLSRTERLLDRVWLGREFTPVEAVKHILAAMQPATDEATLIAAAEARLSEIFGARIAVLVGSRAVFESPVEVEVKLTSPVSGAIVRIAVLKEASGRRLMSEDLVLLRSLGSVFAFMLENIRLQRKRVEQEQLAQELQLQSSKSELKALRAQINPHFLFNALNAIASLIHTDPARADEAVEQLAEVFRYTLRRSHSEWAPLDQELTFARAYLDVEQARFGQRLTCSIDSDHTAPAPLIPSMLLQTLLENAVKHGVSQARGPGRIDVIVRTTSEQVTLEVRNTGPGAESHGLRSREGEGFGLHSVRERLKGHFGGRATFKLSRDEAAGVTVARISMPHVRIAA